MQVLGLITARGGSKGIPGKNVRPLAGKPLIAWTIDAARQSGLDRVIVSTDDQEIAQVARRYGAEVPFRRPESLARDDSPHIAAVHHAMDWLRAEERYLPDYVMTLQPTSPLRSADEIDGAIELVRARSAVAVVSVYELHPHPYWAKQIGADGTLANYFPDTPPDLRRQSLVPAYALNGAIYLNQRSQLERLPAMTPPGAVPFVMPAWKSLDIDTLWEFELAERILTHGFRIAA
jgi:CMP-N-acetylneuraminic acid synthetase